MVTRHSKFTIAAIVVAFCVVVSEMTSQQLREFSFQGVLSTPELVPVVDGDHTIQVRFYESESEQEVVWTETHVVRTRAGVFDIILGSSTPLTIPFDRTYWVGLSVDGGAEMLPRTRLLSVPFSVIAERSDTTRSAGQAHSLAENASGAVLSLNGAMGRLTLVGEGGLRVSSNGTAILLSLERSFVERITSTDSSIIVETTPSGTDVRLRPTTVKSGTYGTRDSIPSMTVDQYGRVVDIRTVPVRRSDTTAGGDLRGLYPNPTVVGLQGRSVAPSAPSTGQVLTWNGTSWIPQNPDTGLLYSAGTGISITGTTIANTGDADASNDITTTTNAGGDLGGTYPNPSVHKIRGRDVSTTAPAVGQVLKWNGSEWVPQNDDNDNTSYTAGAGISITASTIANTGDTDASNDITTTTNAGGDLGGTYPNPLVQKIRGRDVSTTAPAVGQVLKWNGTEWVPQNDDNDNTSYTAGTGISITGTTIANTGDTDASNDITTTTNAGGDLGGTYPNPLVQKIRGRDVSTTAPAVGQVLKWNGTEWVPQNDDNDNTSYTAGTGISITGTTIANTGDTDASNDITTTTNAGGDLGGTYPNPLVQKIRGRDVSTTAPAVGQVLKWNGTEWVPQNDDNDNTSYTAGAGINITGTTIANTGDTDASNDITTTTNAGGDLGGTYPNPSVNRIRGRDVQNVAPADGNVLKWNNANNRWEPAADDGQTYTAGTGINITGTTIANTGDTDASNDITTTTNAGGDLGGTYPNPSVNRIRGRDVQNVAPADGNVLKWNNANNRWEPAADDGQTYTAGSGISITGTTIANTGDTDASNDITTTTNAGGDLGGTYPNPSVNRIRGRDVQNVAPADGNVLKWNDANNRWEPAADDGQTYTAGTGISITGSMIANTGDTDASNDITTTTNAGGDLGGTYPNPSVNRIRGRDVQNIAPADGNVLKWNNANNRWEPAADDGQSYTAGTGISITGSTIANTGDTDASNDITTTTNAGGDLGGTYPNPSVNRIRGRDVQNIAPADGNVLKWSNANNRWEPAADANTTYSAGLGISIAGTTITNTGDRDSTNDITTSTAAGGDLSGFYPNPTVAKIHGVPVSSTPPIKGQILLYSGSEWAPTDDQTRWFVGGNSVPSVDWFLGSTNNMPLRLRAWSVTRLRLNTNGSIQRTEDGDARGASAVDLQSERLGQWMVASGYQSAILAGMSNEVSGTRSAIIAGQSNTVTGNHSIVLGGTGNQVSSSHSVAGGEDVALNTGAHFSFGFGSTLETSGQYGVVFGSESSAGEFAFAHGFHADAEGDHSLGFGNDATANALHSKAIGDSVFATDIHAVALGRRVQATNDYSMTIGRGSDLSNGTLVNSVANSMMIGFNSDVPTVHITGGSGAIGSTGNVGIGVSNPTRKLDVNGTVRIGTNGTTLNAVIRAAANYNMPALGGGDALTAEFDINGVAVGGSVIVSPGNALPDDVIIAQAWVSAAGVVSVRFVNVGAADVNPAAMDYNITVIQ